MAQGKCTLNFSRNKLKYLIKRGTEYSMRRKNIGVEELNVDFGNLGCRS